MDALIMIFGIPSTGFAIIGFAFIFIALNRFWNKKDTITDKELILVKKDLKLGIILVAIYFMILLLIFLPELF